MKRTILLVLVLFLVVPMTIQAASSYYETKVSQGVNFRAAPSLSGYKFRIIPRGEDIHVIQQLNSAWLQIQVQDGTTGFISANPMYTNYNSTGTSNGTADRIIAYAKSLMGRVTYSFGTRNPAQFIFDCSSFTQYVFKQQGIDLQWGTKYQQNAGSYVSKSNLQKGDLVFFWTSSSNIVNHVGIYIGAGQFIHNSPSSNGLNISNLNVGYWQNHYMKARRVL